MFRAFVRQEVPCTGEHDQDGVTCFASPHSLPFLVNGAFRTDQAASPNRVLDLAQDFFATLGRDVALTALEGRDEDLISAAVAAGYGASDHSEPLQVLARQRLDGHEVAGIDVRTVTEEAAVADYTAVCAEAHAPYGLPDDLFRTLFARPGTMLAPHVHAFVGYDDADPVAAATLFLTHGVAYVGWVAVRPGH